MLDSASRFFHGGEKIPSHDRSNDSLRESHRRLRELVDGYTTDADGYLTLYNEAAVAFWGRRPVLGKDRWCGSWELCAADGAPIPLDRCSLAITLREQRSVRDIEVTAERPDGNTPYVHSAPDASPGCFRQAHRFHELSADITERKRAETELNAARQQLMSELS